MEAKVRRSDIDALGSKTLKFAAAVFENQMGLVGDVDSTKYYAPDALDAMSVARISGASTYNDSQWGMNSWDEDISDSDADFWAQAQIDSAGLKINRPPAAPILSSPSDGAGVNTHTPTFSWNAASDPDTDDAVTSYMIEISASSDFSSLVHWRVNIAGTSWTVPQGFLDQGQYYWRVKARDRGGAVSAPSSSRSFTVDTSPPTVKYNTPSVAGSTMPAAGSASGVGGNYYVSDPGSTIDIDFLNLSIGTKTITVDGNPSDWTGEKHSTIHGVAIRDGEWIYTGSKGDAREDLGADTPNGDLTEFRITCDATNLYILIKSSDITNIDKVHYVVGFDTDGDYTNGYSWLGDDSVSADNSVPLARGYTYVDKMYLLRCAVTGSPTIESWSGATWAAPSDYAISISAVNDSVEARISLADLGIGALPKTARVVAASFINTLGWANSGDTTADIAGAGAGAYDVIDGLGGDFGVQTNYWGREIGANDLDIGRYYDVRLGGEKANIATIDYRVNGGSWQNLAANISSDYTSNWNPFSYATDSSTGCVVDFRAYDTGGNSITQLAAFHYWKGGPPSAVTNLSSLPGSLPGHINLSWTAPGDDGNSNNFDANSRIHIATTTLFADATTYSFWSTTKRDNAEIQISTSGAGPGQSWGRLLTGLAEGVTYYFRIWHRDEAGNWATISVGATTWARVDDTAPAPVTNLSASCASDGTGIVTLSWTAPREDGPTSGGAATSYTIKYSTWDFTNFWDHPSVSTWTIGVPTPGTPGTTQSQRMISLRNNTTYFFHIKSTDDKGNVSPLDVGTTAQRYVQHIVISEIQTDGVNAGDEFVEIYNPLDNAIDLSAWFTRLFRRNSGGTDGTMAITWINPTIPAKGYSLLVGTSSGNSYRGSVAPDATYTIATNNIVADGAVYISTQTTATPVWSATPGPWGYVAVDLVGYGAQPSGGYETASFATSPDANRSLERRGLSGADPTASPGAIEGNSWDTNNNSADFVYTSASDPQNTLSSREPDTTSPNAISDIAAATGASTDGDIKLTWTAPYDDWNLANAQNLLGYPLAATYRIKFALANITDFDNPPSPNYSLDLTTTNVTPATAVGRTITGLNPGTTYYFAIKTKDDSGNWSSWSTSGVNNNNRNFALDLVPTAPTVAVNSVSSWTVTISWTNNPPSNIDDLDKVKIYYATYSFTSETNPNATYYGIVAKTDTPKTITGLLDWTTYFIRLKTVDYGDQGGGFWSFPLESALSTERSTRTLDGTPPSVVNNLSALTGAVNGHIWLNWTAPSDNLGVSYYDIRYRTGGAVDDGNWAAASQIANEPAPAASGTQEWLLVTGLAQDVTYYFKLKSADLAGNISSLSNSAYAYAQSSGAVLLNEVAPSGGNFVEFLVAKHGCFRAMNFYGRAGGDLTLISTFSVSGAWSNTMPTGTFIVLNCAAGSDESAITGGVINIYKNVSLTATDNNFILSGPFGIDYTGGVYVSGNVIDYIVFENQDTTRDSKVTSTMKSMISRGEWSSVLDAVVYDPLAFDAQTARNLASSSGNSAARNTPTTDTNSKADWSFQSKSTAAANAPSTAYAGYGVCSAVPEVALPDEIITATFTYSGTTGAGSFANDDIRHTFTIDIPSGWTPPQTASPAEIGFTTNTFSLTAGYSMTIATLSAGGWRVILPMGDLTGGSSYKITYRGKAPAAEQTYTFTARSDYKGVNVADIGASSQPFIIVDGTPPGAVTNLAAVLTGDLRITLYWTAPGNNNYTGVLDEGSKFHIASTTVLADALDAAYWSPAKRDAAELKISTSGINPGVSLSSGPYILTEGATYYFRLWTKDRAGNWSPVSNGATSYCTAEPPTAINNLAAASSNVGTIDLTWNATGDDGSVGDITGGAYAIQRSTWTNFGSIVWSTANAQVAVSTNVTAGAACGYRDFGLTIGVTYYYRLWLRDENITGWSALSAGATAVASRTVSDGGAFVVYYDTTAYQTPRYRGWTSDFFSSEYSLDNSAAVEPGLSGNYAAAASATKNESVFLVGGKRTATYSGLWAYAHTGSTWTYLNFTPAPAYTDTTVGTVRRFDVAYEQKSGRAVAVYRNENFSTSRPVYRIFNNGVWTSETDTGLDLGSAMHWIKLYPKPQSDEIIMVALLNNFAIVTAVWDGNSWSSGTTLPYASGGTDQQSFDGAYDTLWKRFILVASSRAVNGAVQYTVWDSTSWAASQQFTFNTGGAPLSANDVRWIKLAAHPSTNEILMAVSDGDSTGPNIGAAVWDGSSWAQYATALAANSGGAVGDRPFDIAYGQSSGTGLVSYGKSSVAGRAYYVTYDGSWSAENYVSAVGNANIQRLALAALPSSDEILLLFNDADGKIGSARWNGSSWSAPSVIESTSSARESFSAAYRYDQRAVQDTIAPGSVSTLTGLVLGDGKVQLTWTAPGDDNFSGALKCGSRYLFVYSTATPTESELTWPATYSTLISTYAVNPGNTQQRIISNLPYETTWYFRLRTRDEAGNWSSLSNAATCFVLVAPGMVTDLAAAPGQRGRTIDLNWTAPGDDGYIGQLIAGSKFAIQRSTWSEVVWSTGSVDTVLISTQNVNPGDRQYYTLTGLAPGDTYYIAIWTSDEIPNWSIRSAIVDAYAQPVLLSVTVTPTTYYDFGLLDTAVSSNSATAITVVNTGNVNETYKMRCSNSNNWTSGSSAGYDIFVARAAYHGSRPSVADFDANDNKLTLSDKTSSSSVFSINGAQTAADIDPFVSSSRSAWLRLDTPLATSTSAQQTINVIITAEEP
ncbi:MAG: hypothetical protein QME32_03265 [Endomicrobiia bacterium]|nr:hypothetical protein [Endomicrobiia bacterium]